MFGIFNKGKNNSETDNSKKIDPSKEYLDKKIRQNLDIYFQMIDNIIEQLKDNSKILAEITMLYSRYNLTPFEVSFSELLQINLYNFFYELLILPLSSCSKNEVTTDIFFTYYLSESSINRAKQKLSNEDDKLSLSKTRGETFIDIFNFCIYISQFVDENFVINDEKSKLQQQQIPFQILIFLIQIRNRFIDYIDKDGHYLNSQLLGILAEDDDELNLDQQSVNDANEMEEELNVIYRFFAILNTKYKIAGTTEQLKKDFYNNFKTLSSDILYNQRKNVADNFSDSADLYSLELRLAKEKALQSLLEELNSYIGLGRVKDEVKNLINLVHIRELRKAAGLKLVPLSFHLVFLGNPGTGKTTMARLIGKIYKELGILSKGQLIETDRSGLVAGYVGQTALKTQELIEKAKGGILFIDEAYSLSPMDSSNDFGQEAIETLLKAMEDYRKDFIVIVAGYTDLMKRFLKSNPGLDSRFNTYIYFDDYSTSELLQIFLLLCKNGNYSISTNLYPKLTNYFQMICENKDDSFANGRTVRNLFENAIKKQANRITKLDKPNKKDLQELIEEDLF